MAAAQIYNMVNTIANNLQYTGSTVVDVRSFTAFADTVLAGSLDDVYSALYDLIGKTMIAIDEAEDEERGIVVSAFEYGSILQKLNFQTQQAQTASEFDIANPESPYLVSGKTGVEPRYFNQKIPAFSWTDVAYDDQIRSAFHSPAELAGFTDALFIRMRNAYKVAKLGLADAAIGAMIGYIYNDSTDMNASRRVRHILTEFNTLYHAGSPISADEALIDPQYLEYVRKQIIIDKANLNKLTHLYNTIGASGSEVPIDRRTKDEDLHIDLSIALTTCYSKYWADSFNKELVQLPKHREVVNWGIATDPQSVKVTLDGNTTITVNDILGVMYDKDAVVATLDKSRFVNVYDEWNARNVFKLTAERRYTVDPTENAIIYLND